MTLPWVSLRAYELALSANEEKAATIAKLEGELEKEREAVRNLTASALAFRAIKDPYHPANLTAPPKPIGRKQAATAIRELEEADRKAAQEVRDAARRNADASGPAN